MKKSTWTRGLSLVTQLGFTMITPILICTFIGNLIDYKFDKAPIFTIIMILLGTAAAFRNLFYFATKEIKRQNKKED